MNNGIPWGYYILMGAKARCLYTLELRELIIDPSCGVEGGE